MAKFNIAFDSTMGHEGGYANNPNDRGGETYKGIARKYWPKWGGWVILDKITPHTTANINKVAGSNVALQQAIRGFYQSNFWDNIKLTDISDQQLANNVFDFGVNGGTGRAARFLQMAANKASTCEDVVVDGAIGLKTTGLVNSLNAKAVYEAYNVLKKAHYDSEIENNPSQAQFKNSWYSRIKPYKETI